MEQYVIASTVTRFDLQPERWRCNRKKKEIAFIMMHLLNFIKTALQLSSFYFIFIELNT